MYSATANHRQPPLSPYAAPPETCSQGHSTSLILPTSEGGVICLVCLSNLISNPKSPTIHVSYSLSQLSHALSQPQFLHSVVTFHSHFLVSPLIHCLSSFNDPPIAKQIVSLVLQICDFADSDVYGDFVARVSDRLSSGSLAWSSQQIYILHCMGVLLDHRKANPYIYVKDKYSLTFNLIAGLQSTSEEVQGEVLFVLYKISILQDEYKDDSVANALLDNCSKLLHLSLEALLKTQSDDVRLNCIALLTVLAQRGWFQNTCLNEVERKNSFQADNFVQTAEQTIDGPPLNFLFAEAIKGPLLSSDGQVQVAALDLVFLYLSWADGFREVIEELVEENIADYVFEILRLSGCKDPIVNSCIQVLDLLSAAEHAFRQRLAIGFTSLVPVLRYVAEVPFHPSQTQALKLVWNCVSNIPGTVSSFQSEDIVGIVTVMVKKHSAGEAGVLPETFNLGCSTLVALMKYSSSHGTSSFLSSLCDATRSSVMASLMDYDLCPEQFLYSLYLLKEAYIYSYKGNLTSPINIELRNTILDICKGHLLPWFMMAINTIENEDAILAVIETFHSVLLQDSDTETKFLIDKLVSSSWFSLLYGCLGMFPSEKMKFSVYLMFGSIVDILLGSDCGQTIKDAAFNLPSDPMDSLFLLGQNSSRNSQLITCQSAILLILYASSLYDDRLADDKMVLASVEQFILVNGSAIFYGASSPLRMDLLINLYGLYRGIAKIGCQISYSPEAEKILVHLLYEKDWDLIFTRIHFVSLKWLFQQERIFKYLSEQMLKLCRYNESKGNQIVVCGKASCMINVRLIAELIISGDNFAAMIFVCLLGELLEEDGQEDDIISVIKTIAEIIEIFPSASEQMCMHGIARTVHNLCDHLIYLYPDTFMATCQLVFIFLRSVKSKLLSDDEDWIAIVMKLMDYLIHSSAQDCWTQQSLVVVGILGLVLHHAANQVLNEASRIILLSNPLASVVNKTITEACLKGPALTDQDEETRTGESIIFFLLLIFFSLRGVEAVLPGMLEWHDLLDKDNKKQILTYNSLHCHHFCMLLHFGSPLIKLVSSYCLLEIFKRISDHRNSKPDGLKFRRAYLLSVMGVLEGLIFSSDVTVSMNCSLCLSMLIGWEELEKDLSSVKRSYWCRMIVEELAMFLAVPSMASKSYMIHYRPAVHVAVALLKLKKVPPWLSSVFDDSCMQRIIQNISTSYQSVELVLLLRQLLNSGFLNAEQIASLNRAIQAWRKHLYTEESQNYKAKTSDIMAADADDLGKVCLFLINLMSSLSSPDVDLGQLQCANEQLLAEIELFSNRAAQEQ